MDKRVVGFWILTLAFCLPELGGGVADLVGVAELQAIMTHLGFPLYVMPLLGIWKILGVVAILAPGFRRLKEWAYAGMMFDLTGAAWAHAAAGDPVGQILPPLVLLSFALGSWALRPASRKLPD